MSEKSWPGLSLHSQGQNKPCKIPPCTCSAMPFLHHTHSCIRFLKIQLEINKVKIFEKKSRHAENVNPDENA